MEDALKRLDKLTHEEARMATAQVLKAVRAVDSKVTEVIDGTQAIFTRSRKQIYNLETPDGKEAKQVIQQTANDVDEMKCLSFPSLLGARP